MSYRKQKVILFDIETFPNVIEAWGTYEQNALSILEYSQMASFSWKVLGKPAVFCVTREKKKSDKQLLQALHKVLSSADIIVAHNGDSFDMKTARARMIYHGLDPLPPRITVDTLKVARRHFKFPSNKLNELGKFLGVGKKVKTGGYDLWASCKANDPAAWKLMAKYNKQDVLLLEKVYLKLRAWDEKHPNVAVESPKPDSCPKCGSTKPAYSHGWKYRISTKVRIFKCQDCSGHFYSKKSVPL